MKKPIAKAPGEADAVTRIETPKMLVKLATVAEALVQPWWEDGEAKGDRALFVFCSQTLTKLLLKISNPPLKLMVSGRTWDEAWAALEATLRADETPWEQDDSHQGNGRKKK